MVRFRDVSIRRKLLLINVFTTGIALLLASTAFISYEPVRFEQDVTRQLSTVADVIGANARQAVVSEDRLAGAAVLRGLRAEPRILAACLYGADGRVLALVQRMATCCFPGLFSPGKRPWAPCGCASTAAFRSKPCATRSAW